MKGKKRKKEQVTGYELRKCEKLRENMDDQHQLADKEDAKM